MPKYVELGAVQKKIMEMIGDIRGTYLAQDIGKIPSADVQKVEHGRWIRCNDQGGVKCSKCGHCTNERILKWYQEINGDTCNICYQSANPFYCSRCGARMFEEEKNNEQN